MKFATALASFSAALVLATSVALAQGAPREPVTAVEGEGRQVTFGGTTWNISGSRTEVVIDRNPGDRAAITVGMVCRAEGEGGNATKIDCRSAN